MCVVAPARVLAIEAGEAVVERDGRRRRAILVEPGVAIGDWVVIGSGAVLRRLEPGEAEAIVATLNAARSPDGAASKPGGPP